MEYNNIYKKNTSVWGTEPNFLLQQVYDKFTNSGNFLDLGCGQGRDSIFMLQKGFNVEAIDISKEGIEKIKEYIQKNNLPKDKIFIYCQDVVNYEIINNHFDIINIFNTLQFIPKKEALLLVNDAKNKIKNKGYIIISGFTINDPFYKKTPNNNRCFFETDELKKIFYDFNVIFYDEKEIDDPGHPGSPEPHKHYVVKIIAQKITTENL